MADRTAANIFANIFCILADHADPKVKQTCEVSVRELAIKFWKLYETGRYDFSPEQMECYGELEKLGLARIANIDDECREENDYEYGPE